MNKKIPRPPYDTSPEPTQLTVRGIGSRSIWPLPPVGEAARRDPHLPDPVPRAGRPGVSYADLSPPVREIGQLHSGGGQDFNGFPPRVIYLKPIGMAMTRNLARNQVMGTIDAQWRVGGVSYPYDNGYGPGYHGDAETVWPGNPQVYLRNPGIHPLTNVPPTYRSATNINYIASFAALGPSIADVQVSRLQ